MSDAHGIRMKKRLSGDRNQCPSCHLYFNSTSAFDKHRTGDFSGQRTCLTEQEMAQRGMVVRDDGFWRGTAMPEHAMAQKAAK